MSIQNPGEDQGDGVWPLHRKTPLWCVHTLETIGVSILRTGRAGPLRQHLSIYRQPELVVQLGRVPDLLSPNLAHLLYLYPHHHHGHHFFSALIVCQAL